MRSTTAVARSGPGPTDASSGLDRAPIRDFLRVDAVGAIGGLVAVAVVTVAVEAEAAIALPFLAVLLVALWAADRAVDRNVPLALAVVMIGQWQAAIALAVLFPFLWPVMVLAILLPLVLATPYLSRPQLGLAIAGAAAAGGVVAATALLRDDVGVIQDIDDTVELVVVIASLAALIVPITLVVRQNNSMQRAALVEAQQLNEELRRSERELLESRRRVVEVADQERSRIERDLHDGAQQRLLALGMQLRLLESRTAPGEELHERMVGLSGEVDATVDELRELAHGIYPPLLAARGLAAALHEAARRSGSPVEVSADGVGRLEPGVESALYFTALEAMANAAKHAGRSLVQVDLSASRSVVELSVCDKGPGFDPDAVRSSTGLLSMRDRVSAVGGVLSVESSPGGGTTIRARVPHAPPASAPEVAEAG